MNKVTIICGETASGKSNFAIHLAKEKNGVIINCDSQQIYTDSPILSACPSKEEQSEVPHKLYQFWDGDKAYSVQQFLTDTRKEIETAWQNNQHPIIVGGTGMYIKALTDGISNIPSADPKIREHIRNQSEIDLQSLYKKLQTIDLVSAEKIKANDQQRICRALEIYETTGKPISYFQSLPKEKIIDADFDIIQCTMEKDKLEKRFTERVNKMIQMGALEEAEKIMHKYNTCDPIMKVIGVKECIEFINEEIELGELKEKIVIATRQYAKRQRTYFRNQFPNKTVVAL